MSERLFNGKKIRKIRERQKLRIEQLAAGIGRSVTFARSIENGYTPRRTPAVLQLAEQIAKTLGCTTEEILLPPANGSKISA